MGKSPYAADMAAADRHPLRIRMRMRMCHACACVSVYAKLCVENCCTCSMRIHSLSSRPFMPLLCHDLPSEAIVHMHVYVNVHAYVCTGACISTCMCICICVCMCACMYYTCTYVCVCVREYMRNYMHLLRIVKMASGMLRMVLSAC